MTPIPCVLIQTLAVLDGVGGLLRWEVLGLTLVGIAVARSGHRLARIWPRLWWKKTTARILDIDLRKSRNRVSDGSIVYEPLVKYRYKAGGKEWLGRRITVSSTPGALAWGLKMMTTFKQGAEVEVFYDPDHPDHAVLQQERWQGHTLKLGLWACVAGALMWHVMAS